MTDHAQHLIGEYPHERERLTERVGRWVAELAPALPWWTTGVGLLWLSTRAALAEPLVPSLAVFLLACALLYVGISRCLGYRPLTEQQRAELTSQHLWHLSPAPVEHFDTGQPGVVRLDARRCRIIARMFRRDQPWRRPVKATYFFAGAPSRGAIATNLTPGRRGTLVLVPAGSVTGPMFVRRDGALAVPGGYVGPGTAQRVTAQTGEGD